MERKELGRGGPLASVLGLGCNNFGWRIDAGQSKAVVVAALEAGVSLFDTADVYGDTLSEEFLGRALEHAGEEVAVATKFGVRLPGSPSGPQGSREYVRWAVRGSLARLRTDTIDLYQYHWPDKVTPVDETMGYLAELRQEGLIREFGVSNFDLDQLREAQRGAAASGSRLATVQNRYSILRAAREPELLRECERLGCGLIPYLPLEGGVLTGKFRRGAPPPAGSRFAERPDIWPPEEWLTDDVLDDVEALGRFADERGVSMLDLSLGWLAATPAIASVIAGASSPEQVAANALAVGSRPGPGDLDDLRDLLGRDGERGRWVTSRWRSEP